jgi:transcription antitermination protein NusB
MSDPDGPKRGDRPRGGGRRARHLGRPKRDDTDDPRRSRERALKILFQADVRGVSPEDVLREVAHDDAARAMLDDLDELPPEGAQEERAGAAPAGSASAETGLVDETEAQRIWREERERAEAAGRGEAGPAGEPAAEPLPDAGVPPVDGFTRTLVLGVNDHRGDIDALISRFARRWAISRMPVVDRTVLRLATYELLHEPTAAPVVINEAVELAKSLSTDDSGRYVNGVLESIRKDIAQRRSTEAQDA